MSKIKSRNTKLERLVRGYLFKHGQHYRLGYQLPGKPDIVFVARKTVVFVNGCFWHQHEDCKLAYLPKTNTKFWKNKLEGNKRRDVEVEKILKAKGWKVLKIWECEIEKDFSKSAGRLLNAILEKEQK